MFGGQGSGSSRLGDTWEWDGSNWAQRSPPTDPSSRFNHAMAYDAVRQGVLLFGGAVSFNRLSDTWEWDGSKWTQRSSAGAGGDSGLPVWPAMTYDLARQRGVLFDGSSNQTWEWNGVAWTQRSPATSPGLRQDHAMAYDVVRQRTVLFGGRASSTLLADTWEWDGSNWILRAPATSPSARRGPALAYDASRQRVVLFGGYTDSGWPDLSDTWEWDGSNWTRLNPARSPRGRSDHALACDVGRQRVVLFGGYSHDPMQPGPNDDTWEWDGSNWTQRWPASSPSRRSNHAMAYDAARQRVVLFGGDTGSSYLADTREFDGSNWSQPSPPSNPGGRSDHAMAYDVARQRVVLVSGGWNADTWLYGPLTQATTQAFGTACAGSSGLPILTSNLPYLGNPGFTMDLLSARPASACLFGLTTATQTLPLGPCTLYLADPIILLPSVTNQAGFAAAPRLVVPLEVTLRGLPLYAQAFVADPQGPVLRLAFSPGLRLVVGD
jgi:hypothetical protein